MTDMSGKYCMVTGATSGIGFYTALDIAKTGATVLLVGREENKCVAAVEYIKRASANQAIHYLQADLSAQAQIRQLADQIHEKFPRLDVLVNNAGAFFLRRKVSVDGIEMTFALNHLAYFLLTSLLLDTLKASPGGRVVNVSSGSHHSVRLNFSDLQFKKFYNPVRAYACSKLANILFTYELARRLNGEPVTSNALTPGMVATGIWKKSVPILGSIIGLMMQQIAKSPLEGAQTSVFTATSPELEGVTGRYFVDCKIAPSAPASYDVVAAGNLWEISQELVGL